MFINIYLNISINILNINILYKSIIQLIQLIFISINQSRSFQIILLLINISMMK